MAKREGPRSMKSQVYGSRAWKRVRAEVLARDGYQCRVRTPVCRQVADVVGHRVPWQEGGAWYDKRRAEWA
jgi:5-methylcytosine-specific restriction endonuclease McrA